MKSLFFVPGNTDEQKHVDKVLGTDPWEHLLEQGFPFRALNSDRQEYKAILRSVYPGVRGPPYSHCSSHFFAVSERSELLQRGGYLWHLCELILLSWFYFYSFKKIHGEFVRLFFF